MSRRVSMADVAAAAGVSGQTVSRVVNDSPRVDPATRAAVEAAMARLGYRPHRAARALRTGRTQTVGLVASTLATVGNSRMLQAVADAAASRGYSLVVVTLGGEGAGSASVGGGSASAGRGSASAGRSASASAAGRSASRAASASADIDAAFERLRDQGVDGAIVLNEATDLVRDASTPADIALVVVDSPPDDRFGVVVTDHAGGARDATAHLLALGHPTVHHIAGPAGSFAASERERGWREALAAAGAEASVPLRGDWSAASGYAAGARLGAEVSAVFVANDQMALGVLRAVADAGRPAPAVSVVGFDDVADAADYRPPLTTVRQDFDALGERAMAILVARIEQRAPAPPPYEVVPAALVVRSSTASPQA